VALGVLNAALAVVLFVGALDRHQHGALRVVPEGDVDARGVFAGAARLA